MLLDLELDEDLLLLETSEELIWLFEAIL